MKLVDTMRGVSKDLRRLAGGPFHQQLRDLAGDLDDALDEPNGAVDLAVCVGSECIALHGLRVATWRGTGPCSIYVVCDECRAERLTAEERPHMVELFGAAWIRHLGLHALHLGRTTERSAGA